MGQRIVVRQRSRMPHLPLPVALVVYPIIFVFAVAWFGIKYGARYVSGRPLDGRPRTNATFTERGTVAVNDQGGEAPAIRPSRWSMLPGYKRAVVRLVVPGVVLVVWAAVRTAPMVVLGLVLMVALVALARVAVVGRRRWQSRRFRNVYTRPLARTVAPLVGIQPYVDPDRWMTISPDLEGLAPRLIEPMSPAEQRSREFYSARIEPLLRWTPDHLMRVYWWAGVKVEPLAEPFRRPTEEQPPRVEMRIEDLFISGELAQQIRSIVHAKLGLSDLDEKWDQVGPVATGTWTVRRRPRDKVKLAEIVDLFDKLAEHEFIVGFGPGNKPVVVSLADDSPHIACSAGSGAGKSVLAMIIAIQVLRRGGRVTIIDRKGSHKWAKNLAGVRYCRKAPEMHEALIELAALADANNDASFDSDDKNWRAPVRNFVIFEEMNSTVAQLRNYWTSIWVKGEPKTSPAIQAFRDIMNMGRSGYVNLFGVAQMLTANTTGGPESRESFGVRFLARYTANNWKMLAPECAMPRKSKVRGRWQVVVAGEAHEVQVAFSDDIPFIRALAEPVVPTSHETGTPRFDHEERIGTPPNGDTHGDTTGSVPPDPFGEPITLKEAIEQGIIQGESGDAQKDYEALRKRMQRAEKAGQTVPTPVGKRGKANLYRPADLIEWTVQTAPA